MNDLSSKTVLVVDTGGLFIPIAQRLSRDFGGVYYASEWLDSFPQLNRGIIGDGYSEIKHVDNPLDVTARIDLAVFPDASHAALQLHLEAMGTPVWGARKGDGLELNRALFLRTLNELGLPVPAHTICDGLSELRAVLKDKEDCYVKVSKWRGTFETARWRSWKVDEPLLDVWAMRFGPAKEQIQFIVCDAIDDAEIGADTYCIGGKWPSLMLCGFEAKDNAYLGTVLKREDMPEALTETMDAFSAVLSDHRYRQFWSMEMRGDKFIDATCRAGLPSSASQMELWDNLSEIVWAGAHGELIEPEPTAKFSAEAVLELKRDKDAWGIIEVPDKLRQWMKLAGCCQIDGNICFPAESGGICGDLIGWLVALGDTPREAIETLKEYASNLPDGVTAKVESLADVLKEIDQAESEGVEFTDKQLPTPAIAVE
jgi:hypothetical protein